MLADNTRPGGIGALGACDTSRYGGGSWSSYTQLSRMIANVRSGMKRLGLAESLVGAAGGYQIVLSEHGVEVARTPLISAAGALIGQDGASLIGKGGAGIVAAGGGNIVAGGGGNYGLLSVENTMTEIAPGLYYYKKKR